MTASAENLLISLALAAMMLIPLAESALRAGLGVGIPGSTSIVQHLTLVVGMLGGALAARDDRLLCLSTLQSFLHGRVKAAARIFAYSFGAAMAAFLCVAGAQFVASEREAGNLLIRGVPVWWIQSLLPLGFAAVALRLLRHASRSLRGRGAAVLLAAVIFAIGAHPPVPPSALVLPSLLALLAATVCGAPVFAALGGAALILFWGEGTPIASLSIDHYRQVVNPSFPTLPLFTLAGYFLAEGGASKRLIRVFQALFGHFRGGPAIVTALVCAFFTSFTGASGVTILALGGLLMPILVAAGFKDRAALGLLTGAGSLGLLFPPCLPLILYAIVAQITLKEMFLGGLLPGALLVAMTAWWGTRLSPAAAGRGSVDWKEAGSATWEAKWELMLPLVALGSLFAGFATPVEAAALTALYAFVVEVFLYRDLKITRDAARVMSECGLLVGGVLLILGVALGFTDYLIFAEIPARGLAWVTATIHSRWVFILLLNLFLLIVGCLMDVYSAIVVVAPLIVPMGLAFGMDPVHLGILFLANLELGYLTPPVGMNLFLSSYRFNRPMPEVIRASLPMLLVLAAGVLLISYIPPLTTTLPRWLAR
ncbi:MAG: TRAP transporter large permease subunit [Bryobacterales bacterium]|nr:TRAP transporter large permease subunit [Bryobacterales bacterium]